MLLLPELRVLDTPERLEEVECCPWHLLFARDGHNQKRETRLFRGLDVHTHTPLPTYLPIAVCGFCICSACQPLYPDP